MATETNAPIFTHLGFWSGRQPLLLAMAITSLYYTAQGLLPTNLAAGKNK